MGTLSWSARGRRDLADRVTSAFGRVEGIPATWAYDYDAAGNLLEASRMVTGIVTSVGYAYDRAGRMVAITNGAAVESYVYDAGGSRVKRVKDGTTRYFALDYADGFKRPLAELDSAGAIVRRYVWAGALLLAVVESNGVVRYAHSDGQGSILALTDSSRNVTDQFAYGPYGEPWSRTGTNELPFRWLGGSGVVYAGDGLYLTYHRLYDANLKRFLQSDPKGIAGGVNLYAYGNLSPLVYVDPLGLCADRGIPSFTSFFGFEQLRMAATGWYGGTGIRLNTAQRVIAGVWGVVQAAAEVLAFAPMLGASAMTAGSAITRGSTLTATERAYMTGAYSATRTAVARPTTILKGTSGLRFSGGQTAEDYLRQLMRGSKTRFNDVPVLIGSKRNVLAVREIDALAEGVAHESKVGFVRWTSSAKWQILKDAALVREGAAGISEAHWHFWRSDITGRIGADPRVIRLLDRKGIRYTLHE